MIDSPPVIPVQATPATILVVDDDQAMRTIMGFSLAAFGYLVLDAANGEEAVNIAGDHPEIGLIMLDVVMVGLAGKKLAERLKIDLPGAEVLFCSGHPAALMAHHDIDVKIEHFLQKPCRAPELKRKLEEMLATSGGTSRS